MTLPDGSQKEKGAATPDRAVTYQVWLHLGGDTELNVGALGNCGLAAGWYVYTGSARQGLRARLRRHSDPWATKAIRWHIDYLLTRAPATVYYLALSTEPECAVNAAVGGTIPCPGFGASDCRAGCGSHLRYLGPDFDLQILAP